MKKRIAELLMLFEKKYIEEGYCNDGSLVVSPADRVYIKEMIGSGIVEKRRCVMSRYQLSKSLRLDLVRKHSLIEKWGENIDIFHWKIESLF